MKNITIKIMGFDIIIKYNIGQCRIDLSNIPQSKLHLKPNILQYLEDEGFLMTQEI